jgi:hypothetical protein
MTGTTDNRDLGEMANQILREAEDFPRIPQHLQWARMEELRLEYGRFMDYARKQGVLPNDTLHVTNAVRRVIDSYKPVPVKQEYEHTGPSPKDSSLHMEDAPQSF